MPTSPGSPANPDRQPQAASEQTVWQERVYALASAADGIRQASDQWDAVSDSYCDEDGWPVDETGYADGKVARDAAAWEHVETFLAHGPEVLASVRAAANQPTTWTARSAPTCCACGGSTPYWSERARSAASGIRSSRSWRGRCPGRGSSMRSEPARSATPKAGTTPTNSATAERRWPGLPITWPTGSAMASPRTPRVSRQP